MNTYSIILALINFASIVFIALAIMRLAAKVKALNDRIESDQIFKAYGGTFSVQPAGTNQLRAQIVKLDEIIAKKDAKLLKSKNKLDKFLVDNACAKQDRMLQIIHLSDKVEEHEKTIEALSVTSDALSLENEQLKAALLISDNELTKRGIGRIYYEGEYLKDHPAFKRHTKETIRTSTAYNGDRIGWFKEAISKSVGTPRKPYAVPERDCIGHISTTNETVKMSDLETQEIKPKLRGVFGAIGVVKSDTPEEGAFTEAIKDHSNPIMKVDGSALEDIDFRGENPKITMSDIFEKQHELLTARDVYDNPIREELLRRGVKYAAHLKLEQYEDYYKFLTELPEKVKKS